MSEFINAHWGDIASVAGLLIAIVGFIITIIKVTSSQSAAEQAEQAAVNAKDAVFRYDVIVDVSAAIAVMEEIKRLHRANAWHILPDRYSATRKKLIAIRRSSIDLTEEQQALFQSAIQHFSDFESEVESILEADQIPVTISRMNSIVSSLVDRVSEVLIHLRESAGVE